MSLMGRNDEDNTGIAWLGCLQWSSSRSGRGHLCSCRRFLVAIIVAWPTCVHCRGSPGQLTTHEFERQLSPGCHSPRNWVFAGVRNVCLSRQLSFRITPGHLSRLDRASTLGRTELPSACVVTSSCRARHNAYAQMEQEDLEDYGYSYTSPAETSNVVLEPLYAPLGPAEPPPPQHEAQSQLTAAVAAVVMQHSLALASCIGSLVIVLATIALGELVHQLKEVPCQNKCKP